MKHFFCVFLLVLSFNSYTQELPTVNFKNEPVKSVLALLENTFSLRFSYQDATIENQFITLTGKNISLQTIFNKIQQNTDIIFEKINERYYVVRKIHTGKYKFICGYVFDKISLSALHNADIINTSQRIGTTTNKNGYFELYNLKESDTVSIYFLGLKTVKIPVNEFQNEACKKIYLKAFNEQLDEIILKEYITQGVSQSDNGVIKVSPNNLEILPGLTEPDVLESLQALPGIQSPNETASGLFVRGGTPDQNLILWDGIKIYHSGHFFGMISAFNPYITDEIIVYKNGANARYGNRISGVIDIQSQNKIPTAVNGGLGFNMTHADAYFKAPLLNNKVGVIVSARRSFTDAINTFTFKKLTKKTFQNSRIDKDQNSFGLEARETKNDFYFTDFNVKTIIDITPKDRLIFSNLYVKNKLNYSALFSDTNFSDTTTDDLEVNNSGFQLLWHKKWSDKVSHNLSVNSSNYSLDYTGLDEFDQLGEIQINKKNNIKELEIDARTNVELSAKSALEFGYQFSRNNVSFLLRRESFAEEQPVTNEDDITNRIHAFYTEYAFNNKNKINLNIGLRANRISITNDFFLEPRLNIETYLNKNLRLNISGEIKNQSISQIIEFETLDFGLENQLWALSNGEEFPVLNSKQISTGLHFSKNNWNLSVDGYYKRIKGLSSFTRGFSTTLSSFSNGSSDNYGVDFLIKKRIKNYRTWVSYSFGRSDFLFDNIKNGNKFAGNFDIRHSLNWAHTLRLGNFKLSLGWRFRTGRPFTQLKIKQSAEQVELDSENITINGNRLPNYHRLDFSSTYSFKFSKKSKWKNTLGFSILNIYGQKNVLNKYYFVTKNESDNYELVENNIISLGFTPNIVFRTNF